jgi:RNA polymerase sigma-70 factor (ECF subfamily)
MTQDPRIRREKLMHREVLAGNEDAWRTWYEEHFDALFSYIWWRSGAQRELAEDATQETWLTAVRKIRSFDPERADFPSWLRGIANNILRNCFRKTARRSASSTPFDEKAHGSAAAIGENNVPTRPSQLVALALSDLPERYEEALRAKYLEGLSVLQIASAWGETEKAVESVLSRARQAFRQAIERMERGDEQQ